MKIAVIGLGKMGYAIASKLHAHNHTIIGYDCNEFIRNQIFQEGVAVSDALEQLCDADVFWIMVPAGEIVDHILTIILPLCKKQVVIVDGGNSFYKDSQRRASYALEKGVWYLDCGTSGGIHGMKHGFCLMVGGEYTAYERIKHIFKDLSVDGGYGYVGKSGAGHYTKMVHNGIEYGLMQAYAEGMHILKEGSFKHEKLDLAAITGLWSTNSIIRSFLLDLLHNGMTEDTTLLKVSGKVAENGMGLWTHTEAQAHTIPDPVLQKSLEVRATSWQTGGNYGTKIVSLLRNKFGGHNYNHME